MSWTPALRDIPRALNNEHVASDRGVASGTAFGGGS